MAGPSPTGALTMAEATALVRTAVEAGDRALQLAPSGHPLYAAVADGREALAWFESQTPFYSAAGPIVTVASRTHANMVRVTSAIYDAMASLRNDPDAPLPASIYATRVPWPWIGAGAAALIGLAVVFRRPRGRR